MYVKLQTHENTSEMQSEMQTLFQIKIIKWDAKVKPAMIEITASRKKASSTHIK
jgi:hypothetical protein